MKKHKIKKLKDICNAVNNDNIDVLTKDIANWLKMYNDTVQELRKSLPKEFKNKKNSEILEGYFHWFDDGKNDCLGSEIKVKKPKRKFTGFQDMHGKDIHEGNILSDKVETDEGIIESKEQVFWNQEHRQWHLDCSYHQDKSESYPLFQALKSFDYKIIGNAD